jgi:hypothetical protein
MFSGIYGNEDIANLAPAHAGFYEPFKVHFTEGCWVVEDVVTEEV